MKTRASATSSAWPSALDEGTALLFARADGSGRRAGRLLLDRGFALALQRLVCRRRQVGERHARREEDAGGRPGRLREEVTGAATTEHLLRARSAQGSEAAALARLNQHHQHQEIIVQNEHSNLQ